MKLIKLSGVALLALIISFFTVTWTFEGPESYDLVIKNARIIDGSGGEVFQGEIAINEGLIVKIDKKLQGKSKIIFDATGFTIAPQKIEWPLKEEWVERDLASALLRYPPERLLVVESLSSKWLGKTIQALIYEEEIDLTVLSQDVQTKVKIIPKFEVPNLNTSVSAFYWLTGWRSEMLGENMGMIKEGFPAQLIVFNHREIGEEDLLAFLLEEKFPPIQYYIEGDKVKSPKISF